ncbi:hypothetical protein LH47_02691 [Anoxybacillus thermarum]|uniref:Uncharacterized protein n=1 Tax=Anoxybacillus thermarum TaxID=404937 RepID=A0A0D0QUQ8_9BACL|nr:hypothetical protein [Anoxybacillus thermarum]KIQ93224.1 hypothetical protein LH47_02691 [Anoxybacillus thermarum]
MNHIKPIALLVEEKRIVDALAQVRPLMASWDEIEPFRTLVRLFDYALHRCLSPPEVCRKALRREISVGLFFCLPFL